MTSKTKRLSILLLLAVLIGVGFKLGLSSQEIYVSPEGKEGNEGTKESPLSFSGAISKLSTQLKEDGKAKGKITINVGGGVYHFEEPVVLGEEFKGSENSPIRICAAEGEEAIFDGSKIIDPESFSKVSDQKDRERLAKSAANKIYVTTITDKTLIKVFSKQLMLNLNYNGKDYLPSVFPNEGYAYFVEKTVTPEISAPAVPVGKEGYGVRAGFVPYKEDAKPRGWKGSLEEPRGARANIKNEKDMAGSWKQWEDELKVTNRRNQLTGFIEANWLLSSQPIFAASEKDRCLHLSRALGYGWAWKNNDKPFRVFGMLCEVDTPGEWYFDTNSNKLYIYPVGKLDKDSRISMSVANGFMELKGASNVEVIGLSVRNVGGGTIYNIQGNHNTVAGATISNSTARGVSIDGNNNSLIGCDLVDLNSHLGLGGGKRSANEITSANNLVENCHFYQKNYKHEKVNIGMSGVGNTFRNNLIHNSIGQAMVVNGNDHMIELNEFFNVGFDEGDGGAVYSGADLAGYGNVYRYNFFHHLMHHPGKVERSGIHLDDGQSGATCYGNVFYKSAGKGLFAFGGSGHSMYDNIFLNGYRGVYFVRSLGDKMLNIEREIRKDPKSHYVGMKEDYVGRVEKLIGKEGWNTPVWKEKYPLFAEVMSDTARFGRLWPTHYTIKNNYSYDNKYSRIDDSRIDVEAMAKNSVEKYKEITPNDFVDYDHMDFKIKDSEKFPNIPFEKIGLLKDQYRTEVPDKAHYRNEVRKFFKGISSMPGTKKTIDTSKLVE